MWHEASLHKYLQDRYGGCLARLPFVAGCIDFALHSALYEPAYRQETVPPNAFRDVFGCSMLRYAVLIGKDTQRFARQALSFHTGRPISVWQAALRETTQYRRNTWIPPTRFVLGAMLCCCVHRTINWWVSNPSSCATPQKVSRNTPPLATSLMPACSLQLLHPARGIPPDSKSFCGASFRA